jgi:cytochrome oxidase Cu insertion factor (SCO1/SenC/PrrC family)
MWKRRRDESLLDCPTGGRCPRDVPPALAQHTHGPSIESIRPRADSIYELSAVLVDQGGTRVGLDLFRGHPVLISMFYASCGDACPLLVAEISE